MLVLARKSRESVVITADDASQELVRVTVIERLWWPGEIGFPGGQRCGHPSRGSVGACPRGKAGNQAQGTCREAKVPGAVHRLSVKD